jgi:hypothetical protein
MNAAHVWYMNRFFLHFMASQHAGSKFLRNAEYFLIANIPAIDCLNLNWVKKQTQKYIVNFASKTQGPMWKSSVFPAAGLRKMIAGYSQVLPYVDCTPPTYVVCLLQKRIMPSPVKLHSSVTSRLISTEEASVSWRNGASGRIEFGHTGLHCMPDDGGVWTLCSFYVVCKYLLFT